MTQTRQVITKRMQQQKDTIIQGNKGRIKTSEIVEVPEVKPVKTKTEPKPQRQRKKPTKKAKSKKTR
jgi:hypothetical protein